MRGRAVDRAVAVEVEAVAVPGAHQALGRGGVVGVGCVVRGVAAVAAPDQPEEPGAQAGASPRPRRPRRARR